MKFYISNVELDSQISEIRTKIRLSMNGITSEKMSQSGILYEKNYGVAIPRLKEIAKCYNPNLDLAQRLWFLQIRETMIIATLLCPTENFTPLMAENWTKCFNQIEIVEQVSMNLFSRLSFAPSLVLNWIKSENDWLRITSCQVAARIYEKFTAEEIKEIISVILSISETENLHLYKAEALCLSRFCRRDNTLAVKILMKVKIFEKSPFLSQNYIWNEVKQEILFLDIL
jgi:3-methyladenine DNA glycosylase AlkD